MAEEPRYPHTTRKSGYSYIFSTKHHGGGAFRDACWDPNLRRPEGVSGFDTADFQGISDGGGWIYGVLAAADGELRDLGTWQQQIAEFPWANPGVPWHGYPIWAVNGEAPENRSSERMRPAKAVFDKS